MTTTTAYVLAGGLGTRLRPLVSDRPKPMAMVAGRPFLEHLLGYWIGQGVSKFVLCLGHLADVTKEHFGQNYLGASILYSMESEPQGTGGALAIALENYPPDGRFLVLNGDSFFKVPLPSLEQMMVDHSATWVTSLFASSDVRRYGGVQLGSDDALLKKDDRAPSQTTDASPNLWVNGGVWLGNLSKPKVTLTSLAPPYSLEEYLEVVREKGLGEVFGLRSSAVFIDIGVPTDYRRAQNMSDFTKG